ncbi:uncharacterized protein [Littorina saxatilis]|uniref:ShKT domain-containing protein n=1 Tax=Littorina saxatilis TaxID=31220 RepID=A0AAN9APZ4_9CAEN
MARVVTVGYCLLVFFGNGIVLAASSGQQLRPGEATETHSCNHVRHPPAELSDPQVMRPNGENITFYQKYTEAYGIPILGSSNVTDDALKRACYTVRYLFAGHSGIRAMFYKFGGRFAIMSATEVTLDFPEFSSWDPFWNSRARGLGASWTTPLTTGAEENLLCQRNDRYHPEDIFLHESAHAVDLIGAWAAIPGFRPAVNNAFRHANVTGLWDNTYAATNALEYWAEGVQSYFNVNTKGPSGGNGIHNDIATRDKLRDYDPTLFKLIQEAFPCKNTYLKRCESTREMENNEVLQMNCNSDDHSYRMRVLAILSAKDPSCQDTRPLDCLHWSLSGECENNPGYMLGNCKASCKVCSPSNCYDENDNCPGWSRSGECEKNPAYMLWNCRLSCRQCTRTTADPLVG